MPARRHRILRGAEYRNVVRRGIRVGGALSTTHAVFHSSRSESGRPVVPRPARFGFIVSKAIGNAVTRNLVRRRMKFITEQRLASGFSGADVVFRALPASAQAPYADLARELHRSLDRVEQYARASQNKESR